MWKVHRLANVALVAAGCKHDLVRATQTDSVQQITVCHCRACPGPLKHELKASVHAVQAKTIDAGSKAAVHNQWRTLLTTALPPHKSLMMLRKTPLEHQVHHGFAALSNAHLSRLPVQAGRLEPGQQSRAPLSLAIILLLSILHEDHQNPHEDCHEVHEKAHGMLDVVLLSCIGPLNDHLQQQNHTQQASQSGGHANWLAKSGICQVKIFRQGCMILFKLAQVTSQAAPGAKVLSEPLTEPACARWNGARLRRQEQKDCNDSDRWADQTFSSECITWVSNRT